MKTQISGRARGFTLIELLVVITIIAVLAGAGFAAGNAALQKARKTTALATIVGIETSVNNFFNEYGSMPLENLTNDTTVETDAGQGVDLLRTLLGTEPTTGTPLNNRNIKFLNVKEGKNDKNGLVYNGNTTSSPLKGLYDPWGGSFSVILDGDYDESVTPAPSAGGTPVPLRGRRVAAWSNGADGVTSGGKAADDVKSW